jgi:hypothetical protein
LQDVLQAVVDSQQQHEQQQQQQPVQRHEEGQGGGCRLSYVHPSIPCAVMLPGAGPLSINYSVTGKSLLS